jgi:hypothetical protein
MNTPTIKTAPRHTFHTSGDASKKQKLFTVTPDIPLVDALNSVSDMLDMMHEPIFAAAMGEQALEHNQAWLVLHTLESAKAVIDSLWAAADDAEMSCLTDGKEAAE